MKTVCCVKCKKENKKKTYDFISVKHSKHDKVKLKVARFFQGIKGSFKIDNSNIIPKIQQKAVKACGPKMQGHFIIIQVYWQQVNKRTGYEKSILVVFNLSEVQISTSF